MQDSKLVIQDEYNRKLLSLCELINIFTRRLEIKNRIFYSKINKELKQSHLLRSLSYNENGLLSFEIIFESYKKAKETGNVIYQIAPYLSSLSRLLSLIYTQASNILGKEKTKKILKESLDLAKKKNREIPNLGGYTPKEIFGKKEAKGTTTFSVSLADSMIKYLVENIIIKKSKIKEIKPSEEEREKHVEEEIAKFFE